MYESRLVPIDVDLLEGWTLALNEAMLQPSDAYGLQDAFRATIGLIESIVQVFEHTQCARAVMIDRDTLSPLQRSLLDVAVERQRSGQRGLLVAAVQDAMNEALQDLQRVGE